MSPCLCQNPRGDSRNSLGEIYCCFCSNWVEQSYYVSTSEHFTNISFSWSWLLGRRPEYTDPKVVAHGEGREGLLWRRSFSQTTGPRPLASQLLHLCVCCSDPRSLPRFCHRVFSHHDQRYEGAGLRCGTIEHWEHTRLVYGVTATQDWKWDWWALILTSVMFTLYTWGWRRLLQFRSEDSKKEVSHPNRCLVVEIRIRSGFLYGFALHFYCLFTFVK